MLKGIQDINVATDEPSLAAFVKSARQAGFDVFEPTLADSGTIAITTEEANCQRVSEIIRSEGLTVHAVYCPMLSRSPLSTIDASVQQQAQDTIKAALDRTAWLGAAVLVVEAGRITDETGKQQPPMPTH